MSGFFGVFSPKGNVDRRVFDQMQRNSQCIDCEELNIHVEKYIAMGHLTLPESPKSVYESQPQESKCGRFLLVGHFRLDYRDELADKLGLTQRQLDETSDSVLAIKSYQKWSEKCINHLEGDWAFVVYDRVLNNISCFKDKYGTSVIFYKQVDEQFLFATNIKVFYDLYLTPKQIDYHQLYRLSVNGLEMEKGHTLLKDVYRQSPCTYLIINKTNAISVIKYYEFDHYPRVEYKFEFDYCLDFRSLFSIAIKSKIGNLKKVGVFQSSGLDSNALLYFLANEMKYRSGYVYTYTSCNAFQEQIEEKYFQYVSDDLLFKESLNTYSNVFAKFLDFKGLNFEEEFKASITDFDYPVVTKSKFWLKGILKRSKEDGVQMMFTGQLGNFTITWNRPKGLLYDFLTFKFMTVSKEFIYLKSRFNISFFKVFQIQIKKPLTDFLKYQFRLALHKFNFKKLKSSLFTNSSIKKINYKLELKNEGSLLSIPIILNPEKLRKYVVNLNGEVTGARWYTTGCEHAIIVNDPTIDSRLVDFLFKIPSSLYLHKGIQKYLFRKTFEGRIYSPILNNDFTIQQTFDLAYRLSSNSSFFRNYFANIKGTELWQREPLVRSIENEYENIFLQRTTLMKYNAAANFLNKFSILYIYNELNGKQSQEYNNRR